MALAPKADNVRTRRRPSLPARYVEHGIALDLDATAGLSRYEPDPLAALERVEAKKRQTPKWGRPVMPLSLSDDELMALLDEARPIPPRDRDPILRDAFPRLPSNRTCDRYAKIDANDDPNRTSWHEHSSYDTLIQYGGKVSRYSRDPR